MINWKLLGEVRLSRASRAKHLILICNAWEVNFKFEYIYIHTYIHTLQLLKYYKSSMLMVPRTHAPAWWPGEQFLGINALQGGG